MKSIHLAALLVLGCCACVTPRYRYDRLKDANVELRDLEQLVNDGAITPGTGPRGGLELKVQQIAYDFSQERDEYRIGKNDVLDVWVLGHPEMGSPRTENGPSAGVTVQKDGSLYLPVIGTVPAAGMTVVELRQALVQAAAKFVVGPEISVQILRHDSQKFFVLGDVSKPGAFVVDGDTTLVEGLAAAGGVLPTSNLEAAHVVRGGGVLPINVADVLQRGDLSRNVYMRHGDVVFVPSAADQKIFVLGEVGRPTVVPMNQGRISLAEALAAAGGPTAAHARKELAVIRGGFAKPMVYLVDLERALLHDDRILLKPGDRVVVAPTGLSTASKYMQQVLPFLQGVQAIGIAAQGASNLATQITAAQAVP